MLDAPLPITEFEELAILIRAHHPLVQLDAREPERVLVLLRYLCSEFHLPFFEWSLGKGLKRSDQDRAVYGTERLGSALSHIAAANGEAVYHFNLGGEDLTEPRVVSLLHDIDQKLSRHRGMIVFSFAGRVPEDLTPSVAAIKLSPPTKEEYYAYVNGILKDVQKRQRVSVKLNQSELQQLLSHLRGLTLMEVRRLMTSTLVERGALDAQTTKRIIEAKSKAVAQNAALEYFPADTTFEQIAGMRHLKSWLDKRSKLFSSPQEAQKFGLSAPRGLLLLGVQGCGKSATAKAVASAWNLPILRLDAGRLYDKYVGATEQNLNNALKTAERLAPLVLWVDEIEKALGQGDNDGGTSARVLGSFLTWLQENRSGVFVVATANDISRLPPELLRKGRFDEIFFVDLPSAEVRRQILAVHLQRRGQDPERFNLNILAALADGFSGGELEQAVVAALFNAFSQNEQLSNEHLSAELTATRPLSVVMQEKVSALRDWALQRCVLAG